MISPPGVQGFHPPFLIFPLHHPKTHHNWCKHAFCFSFHIIMMIMMFLPLYQIRWLFCELFGEGDREGDCDPVSRTPCSATVDTEFPCRTDTVPLGSRSDLAILILKHVCDLVYTVPPRLMCLQTSEGEEQIHHVVGERESQAGLFRPLLSPLIPTLQTGEWSKGVQGRCDNFVAREEGERILCFNEVITSGRLAVWMFWEV